MSKLKVIELFAGIGSQHQALKNIGVGHEVVAICEWDKYAYKSYEALHGETINLGDITMVEKLPDCDLLTYSFPCQDISVAGSQAGLDKGSETKSGLLWEVERLLKQYKLSNTLPKYLLLENVKNLLGKNHIENFNKWIKFLDGLGYNTYYEVLSAKDYGVPQDRKRGFAVSILKEYDNGFKFPSKIKMNCLLKDILLDEVDEKYYKQKRLNFTPNLNKNSNIRGFVDVGTYELSNRVYDGDSVGFTLRAKKSDQLIMQNNRFRYLTPKECGRLMGFKDSEIDKLMAITSDNQLYKQFGNSIVVNVLEEIFKELLLK